MSALLYLHLEDMFTVNRFEQLVYLLLRTFYRDLHVRLKYTIQRKEVIFLAFPL